MKWVMHLGVTNENELLDKTQSKIHNMQLLQIYNTVLILKSCLKTL